MALSIDTDSTPSVTNGSISSCDDIEGGYSSQEEYAVNAQDKLIVPKCITINGYTRRLSTCSSLPTQRHSRQAEDITSSSSAAVDNVHQSLSSQYSTQESRTNHAAPRFKTIMYGIVFVLFSTSIAHYTQQTRVQSLHHQLNALHKSRRSLEESHNQLSNELQTASFDLAQYKNTHEKMKKINQDMSAHMRRLKEAEDRESVSELEKRAENAESRLKNMIDSIRSSSAQQVLQKYGPGPHQVELLVTFPGSEATQTIKLELASIDTKYGMPHAVHTFLEQIESKSWDGAAFGFHAGHVLLAVPSPSPDGKVVKKAPSVLFPEYNNAYPHEKYTVAFPGKQGTGQDFYINVQSNVIHHAPKMQDGKFVEGEPCFARIVDEDSRHVVDEMDKIAINSNRSLKERVVIQEARIVGFEGR